MNYQEICQKIVQAIKDANIIDRVGTKPFDKVDPNNVKGLYIYLTLKNSRRHEHESLAIGEVHLGCIIKHLTQKIQKESITS